MRLRILEEAFQDIEESVHFYQAQAPGLEREFVADVWGAFGRITQNPERFSRIGRRYRKCVLSRFPFRVFIV
jgi:hypothetical protein